VNATKEEIVELLRQRMENLCQLLLPGGKREGREWVCGGVEGHAGKSMHVVLTGPKTGLWTDFASDEGGDVLKLIQRTQNLPDYKAVMDWARDWLGLPPWSPDPNAPKLFNPLSKTWKGMTGTRYWTYRDAEGAVIGYVVRFNLGDGKKDTIPMRCIDGQWTWKGWKSGEEQAPLYGLELLKKRPTAPLLLVEGEKACDAARLLFPERLCLSWQGGSKRVRNVDWQPVIDHILANSETPDFDVIMWGDADEPGVKARQYLVTLLPGEPKAVDVTNLPEGWDLADEAPDGVDIQALLDAAKYNLPKGKRAKKEKARLPEEKLVGDTQEPLGDLPELEEMELPDGVEWRGEKGVQHSVSRYSIFFHNNAMYSKRVMTDKYNTIIKTFFHPIANFHIKILQLLEDEKESQYLLRVTNTKGRTRTFHTGTDFMLNSGNLKKALLGKGDFRYNGNEREADFERLQQLLLEGMGDGQKIDVLGWQHDTRVYAMNDALITPKGEILRYDEFGSTTIDGKHYYVPSANKLFARSPYKYLPQKRFRFVESGVSFKQLVELIVMVHRQHGMIGIVFGVMALFSSKIFAHHGFVPMCFLYGEPSTGKSKLTQAIQHLFGDRQEAMQITGKSTDKAKIRKFAQFIDALVILEEFSNSIGDAGYQWLKGLNDRNGYERGTIDSNFGTDNVPITSAVILTGNDYPQNDALLTRLVVIEMLKNTFSEAEQQRFGELLDLMDKGYSCVIAELMKHREAFEKEYRKHYKEALVDMTQALTLQGVTLERMVQNASILMAVYRFFEAEGRVDWPMTRAQFQGALVESMVAQHTKRDTGGDVAKWWASLQAAIKAEDLVAGEDFKIDGDKFYLRFTDCHEQYSIYHQKLYRAPGHVTATMRTKLEKSPHFLMQVKATKFGNVNTSAYVFSLEKIGEDFAMSVLMKRRGKYARKGPEPPPEAGDAPNNGNGPSPNGTGPGVLVTAGEEEEELPF
jgi:hypothetical protein